MWRTNKIYRNLLELEWTEKICVVSGIGYASYKRYSARFALCNKIPVLFEKICWLAAKQFITQQVSGLTRHKVFAHTYRNWHSEMEWIVTFYLRTLEHILVGFRTPNSSPSPAGSAVCSTLKSHASNISGTPIWVPHSVLSRLWVFRWGERRNAQGFQLWCRAMDSQTSKTKISRVCSKRYYMCHVLVLQNFWNSVHPSISKRNLHTLTCWDI